jgi:hypothetical protein
MDKMEILNKARHLGGEQGEKRRQRLIEVAVAARKEGCNVNTSKGNSGTLQIRYGGLNLPVIDVSADGSVTVYFRARFKGDNKQELADELQALVEENDDLPLSIGNRKFSGKLKEKIEDIQEGTLIEFLTGSVKAIQDKVYDDD